MPTTGRAIIRNDGKLGIAPSGKVAIATATGDCGCCGPVEPPDACGRDGTGTLIDLNFPFPQTSTNNGEVATPSPNWTAVAFQLDIETIDRALGGGQNIDLIRLNQGLGDLIKITSEQNVETEIVVFGTTYTVADWIRDPEVIDISVARTPSGFDIGTLDGTVTYRGIQYTGQLVSTDSAYDTFCGWDWSISNSPSGGLPGTILFNRIYLEST